MKSRVCHLQLKRVGFDSFNSGVFAVYGAQPPRYGVHAVERGYEPQSIVCGDLCRILRKALHINQAPSLVDDVSVRQ